MCHVFYKFYIQKPENMAYFLRECTMYFFKIKFLIQEMRIKARDHVLFLRECIMYFLNKIPYLRDENKIENMAYFLKRVDDVLS